jgi:GNAT superfamily N-acetyltransferase
MTWTNPYRSSRSFNTNTVEVANAMTIRLCRDDERDDILSIINAAAEAYRGVIPTDRWHEPYMPGDEFDRERAAGVVFWGYEDRGRLTGIMGLQEVRDVNLIRHAYVVPAKQRDGIGGKLVAYLLEMSTKPMLVGTWAAATGRSAFMSATALRWCRRNARPRCSNPTGPFRSGRLKPRSCWPIRRIAASRPSVLLQPPRRL